MPGKPLRNGQFYGKVIKEKYVWHTAETVRRGKRHGGKQYGVIIDMLCEMTETARQEGYSVLHEKYRDRMDDEFFQCAVVLVADMSVPKISSQV